MSFSKIFDFTMNWEGWNAVTNDPDDPGGLTKYGLSQRAHTNLDIANLTLDEAKSVYKKQYWEPIATYKDDLLDMAAFDSAVNCGVPTVKKWLKTCTNVGTLLDRRKAYYSAIVEQRPKNQKYIKGWTNRVNALKKFLEAA